MPQPSGVLRYDTKIDRLILGGTEIELESLSDLDATIDAYFAEYELTGKTELFEDLCPYFGKLWPAGLELARYAADRARDWSGKSVLEVGCGLALPSLALAKLGCAVSAMDVHPDVPTFLTRNIARNKVAGLDWSLGDWRQPSGHKWDVILGSDVLYDREQPAQLLAFLAEAAAPGAEVVLTDPGRIYYNRFLREAQRISWKVEESTLGEVYLARLKSSR